MSLRSIGRVPAPDSLDVDGLDMSTTKMIRVMTTRLRIRRHRGRLLCGDSPTGSVSDVIAAVPFPG